MKSSWLVWFFIFGFVVTVLAAFNYQKEKETIPLSEIFPDEEVIPVDVEYEFIEQEDIKADVISIVEKVIPVKEEVTVITPVKVKPLLKKESTPKVSKYSIQIASFKKRERAQKAVEVLIQKGYSSAYILSRHLGEKGTWYRVYVGNFEIRHKAKELLKKVKQDYPDSFTVKL